MRRFVSRLLSISLIYAVQRVVICVLDTSEAECALIMTSVVYTLLLDLTDRFERHEREDGEEDGV